MKPIWFFVGWLLLVIGVLLVGTGIYDLFSPPERLPVLYELRTSIWWGALVALTGLVFLLANRHRRVE